MTWLAYNLKDLYSSTYCPTTSLHTRTLDEHANTLAQTIRGRLSNTVTKVDFVTYSMGGLLLRALLNHFDQSAIGQIVMIAPPNQGAEMAELVRRFVPVHHFGWDPLQQLLPESPNLLPEPAEHIDLLVIAGVKGDGKGFQPFLSEDNDGKVCVSETFLDRQHKHHVVVGRHFALILQPSTINGVKSFLSTSRLV